LLGASVKSEFSVNRHHEFVIHKIIRKYTVARGFSKTVKMPDARIDKASRAPGVGLG
jgi:hypothetical protein